MSPAKLIRTTAIAGALSVAGLLAANVVLTSVAMPGAQPSAVASAKGGTGGGGSIKPSLPADFPIAFPLPTGTLFGSTGVSPTWSVGLNVNGSYSTVLPDLRSFYVAQGFTDLNPTSVIPFGFENASYTIQVVGRSHDHLDTSTDVTIVVNQK